MILAAAVAGSLTLALAPATLGRASTQIETPLTKPQTGNITVATAHAKLNRSGPVKVTLQKGKQLGKGLSLYARPRRSGTTVNVDLIVTNNRSGGSSALQAARVVAVLNSVDPTGFKRNFSADEQSNVFKLPEGGKAEGDICNGKGKGNSRLISGKHVFNSTDAGEVVKDACSAIGGSRSGGAKKLQGELEG
jgi:hypothetical protein